MKKLVSRLLFGAVVLVLRRSGDGLATLCIDLDNFKTVNDTLGHPIGDLLLQSVAARLRSVIREEDTVARLGGDEFAILLTGANGPDEVGAFARRVLGAIAEPYDLDGHHVCVGASIGIAVAPGDGADADRLLKNADMALYRAKSDGRSTFRFFEAEMDARAQARRRLGDLAQERLGARQDEARREGVAQPPVGPAVPFFRQGDALVDRGARGLAQARGHVVAVVHHRLAGEGADAAPGE